MDSESETTIVSDEEDSANQTRGPTRAMHTLSRNALDALADSDNEAGEGPASHEATRRRSSSPMDPWAREILGSDSETSSYDYVVDRIPLRSLEVRVRPVANRSDFPKFAYNPHVEEVLEEFKEHGVMKYAVIRADGAEEELTLDELFNLPGGLQALNEFQQQIAEDNYSDQSNDSDVIMVSTRANRKSPERLGLVSLSNVILSEDEEDEIIQPTRRAPARQKSRFAASFFPEEEEDDESSESESGAFDEWSDLGFRRRKPLSTRKQKVQPSRATKKAHPSYDDSIPVSPGNNGEIPRRPGRASTRSRGPVRRSEREKKGKSMREIGEDYIPEVRLHTDKPLVPKAAGAKEAFKKLPHADDFRRRHLQICDTCNETAEVDGKGFLIYCQGCTLAYHVPCLGSRTGREHLVTKVGEGNFILQCRRCVETPRKKDRMAPHHGRCVACGIAGSSCKPFRSYKSPREEEKEREQNNGVDPITVVPATLVNNPANVLFRCVGCYQSFHMHHLPPKDDEHSMIEKLDDAAKARKRLSEYSNTWLCHDCESAPAEIGGLVAWRPKDVDSYEAGLTVEQMPEDEKEYLIKWQDKSYYRSTWKDGAWVWGKTSQSTRKAFAKKDDYGNLPRMRTEDAIPEDHLRVDIVFDVKYNNKVSVEIEEVDRARIREVKQAYVKYKGLAYEDAVWEEPPPVEDKERYADFKIAYEDWVRGKYIHVLAPETLQKNTRKVKAMKFEEKILQKEQPKSLKGGQLMQHQQDGLNWLLYKWYSSQNGILADEMGLGKTIQIIAFMATLQEKFNLCPFLIVVPNSTCANWRREIKHWAPALRVATFFGSAAARDLAQKYELFPKRDKTLRCHVVVTSYDAAQDEGCQRIFNRIHWTALVVDEGQRLKNDKNLLYHALSTLKVSFTVLLTGTPIQNNPRELFNLLAFLDKDLNAAQLEEENQELTQEKVEKVHQMLKSFILRRTKRQTLKDLPPMAQIIVPITMSPLQKKLYKSILGKNAELLKAIFGGGLQGSIRGLRNILVQLRQCLCHPYVYNQDIEGRAEEASSHRQLVEASAKLQILDIMLPKLKQRGHRVLIFSQFLHMLTIVEDFLSGLALEYLRLDGSMSSMEKQKCIDAFNAPDSSIFALLLSTRAGGVGINLATADTVIIIDPDFNPHQDIQAISRAHRLGQQKKVLVFQLMTRMSAEEKILQIGKKKMALDHVLIEQMDRDEEDGKDLESVLRYGAEALFKDDVTHNIRYDSVSVDKLLDRSQTEDTEKGKDDSAESSFSFARIWQNESSAMTDQVLLGEDNVANSDDVWQKIMEERQRQADEAREKEAQLGRGKRNRKNVNYGGQATTGNDLDPGYVGEPDFDPDFQVHVSSEEEEEELSSAEVASDQELLERSERRRSDAKVASPRSQTFQGKTFRRAKVREPPVPSQPQAASARCQACNDRHGAHDPGVCPIKLAGFENCNLCGQAHYGVPGSCLALMSEEVVRTLFKTLDKSPEERRIIELAKMHLRHDLGRIVQDKKRKLEDLSNKRLVPNGSMSANGSAINGTHAAKKRAAVPASENGRAITSIQALPRDPTMQNPKPMPGGPMYHNGTLSQSTSAGNHFPTFSYPPYVRGMPQGQKYSDGQNSAYSMQDSSAETPHQHTHGMPNTPYSHTDRQTHGLPRPDPHMFQSNR